jgi:hypothetical protein
MTRGFCLREARYAMSGLVQSVQSIKSIDHNGERVVTLRMVDELHQRPEGTAGRNFRRNRGRMLEGVDYWEIPPENLPDEIRRPSSSWGGPRDMLILLSESGYLMLVKAFRDDLAWEVQRVLVQHYFRSKSLRTPSEERWLREVGSEIAKGIREGLQEGLKPVNERLDRVEDRLDSIERSVVRRKDLTSATKRQHIDTVAFLGGKCPCCSRVDVIDEHWTKLESANWEHWYAPHRNAPHETWLVCADCNQELRDPKVRASRQRFFDAYQARREQKQYPLLPTWK